MADRYMPQARYRWYKSTLTRRRNRKDWQGLIDLWTDMQAEFDVMPDDWHRWDIAARDAAFELARYCDRYLRTVGKVNR